MSRRKSEEYWAERSGQILLDLLEDGERLHRRLGADFKRAQKNIEKEIAHLYAKHARDNAISPERALETIKGDEYLVWRMTMEEYLAAIAETGDQVLLLELNSLCMKARINRLEALEGEIMGQMATLARVEAEAVGDHLEAVLEDGYYKAMYEHYRYGNPALFELMAAHQVALSKSNIKVVLTRPWSGRNYSQRIWKREHDIANRAREMVTRNVLEGRSIDNLTRELSGLLGSDYEKQVRRLIHTETCYAKAQGDLLTYEKLDVKKYRYLATLDNKTSKPCQNLDGKVFKVEDARPGLNYPPMHPHCRSSTTAHYPGEARDGTRVARGQDGKRYKVPEGLKYHEWRAKYGPPTERARG